MKESTSYSCCRWSIYDALNTINFATLVKEMRLTHYPDLGLIDSAKNSEIAFIHSYKNQQFQYDTTLNLPHLFKKLSEKKK